MSKKILSLLLVLVMLVGCFASCGLFNKEEPNPNPNPNPNPTPDTPEGPGYTVETFVGDYVYKDSVSALAANWNPHTYQTAEDSYPISFITSGLYEFVFNDALINTVEGRDPFTGYKIVPEMAAELPVDVTEEIKAAHPEYNIPESATEGHAYKIALNPNAKWENGEPINADTYVYSMKMLLDPRYQNYRGTDYFDGSLSIANAKDYYYQGQSGLFPSHTLYETYSTDLDAELVWKLGPATEDSPSITYLRTYFESASVGLPKDYSLANTAAFLNSNFGVDVDTVIAMEGKTLAEIKADEAMNAVWATLIGWWQTEPNEEFHFFLANFTYPDVAWENVGIFKSGEYEITIVLSKSLTGFNLLYNLGGNWIVYQPYYDDCMTKMPDSDAYSSTYNTSLETTMSYGPYKMTQYVVDNSMEFERNENWHGYTDGKHVYQDPEDGKVYPMYQTTKITCKKVAESDTNKLMFLAGQLMGYGLQPEDFEEFRDSEYCYATPDETIYFFIFNGHIEAINEREASDDFDATTVDLQTMTLNSFRRAIAVSFDKEAFCTAVSPSRSGGYGLIGNAYLYDPETGARYRDTDQAKKALCEFYSVDISAFETLDDAVASITGFDVETAKEYYRQAYAEALELGYVTDLDNNGISDQTVTVTYASSTAGGSFIKSILDYLNAKLLEVTEGTPFAGKILFVESSSLGNKWSDMLKAGMVDTCLAGWSGSAFDPFGLTDLYTNPAYQYDANWFNSETVDLTLDVKVNGETVTLTMNLREWSDALNGSTVTVDGVEYCFGAGIADVDTRLDILAAIETEVLGTYNYIPMLQNASMALLSKQVYYVVEEYNPVMGRGGIAYMKYNYEESEWAAYVASQGGELSY